MRLQFLAITLLMSSLGAEAQTCHPVDLIDGSSPIVTQEYGADSDSSWCFAFSLANIMGQALGRAVSPEDLALQYYFLRGKVPFKTNSIWQQSIEAVYRYRMIRPDAPAIKLFGLGGDVDVVPQLMAHIGYCAADSGIRDPADPNWFLRLTEQAEGRTAQEMIDGLNRKCGPRMQMPNDLFVKWFELGTKGQTPLQAVANIEKQLHQGKRVIISVKASFTSHVMTVQGITGDCRLIIQNSNALSDQSAEIYSKYNSTHIQLWKRDRLEEIILGYGYLQKASKSL